MAGKFEVFFSVFTFIVQVQSYKLKQVLVLSRHNIRTPLVDNLSSTTSYDFPEWSQKAGFLTQKGAMLEEFMGEYFQKWLVQNNLLRDECPSDDLIHIYANTKQRTKESAKAFAKAAFRNCNVTVLSIDSKEMDPVFNPVPTNTSGELKQAITKEMQEKIDVLHLEDALTELSNILDFKNSNSCKIEKLCDLVNTKNEIVYEIGVEPNIIGPLNLGNALVDSFLMSYYEGMPIENVAWGKITDPKQWNLLTKITKENQNVRFNSTVLAREVAKPLLRYMLEIFEHKNPPKFTLLVGHDSNLNPVMAALDMVPKDLPEQYERMPVGGKLVFQKWEDDSGRDYLKVDFVYQSFVQLRNGTKLSIDDPPFWVSMQIKKCTDENGYCPWGKFMDIMKTIK